MSDSNNTSCSELVWRGSKDKKPLNRNISIDSEYIRFAQQWILKFNEANRANVAEKMIYLWVTVNAWASIVVPDKTRNHEDAYLIHAMSADAVFVERFKELMAKQTHFSTRVNELVNLAPVFQVLWLRNKNIEAWEPENPRKGYVQKVLAKEPFKILKNKDGSESKLYHYRPECAQRHIDKNEPMPADWPHTLHIIYQIRCNLFHGGKNYSSERDRRFIELAFKIIWDMFEPEFRRLNVINTFKHSSVSWQRLFIRSGFYFEKLNNVYNFNCENKHNISYLLEIMSSLGLAEQFSNTGNAFSPETKEYNQEDWLSAIEALHAGAEGGPSDMEQIELKIMDTYMAGIVRWLNYIGLSTTYSCDGHNTQTPVIAFAQSDGSIIFENILNIICPSMKLVRRSRDSNTVSLSVRRANNHRDFDRSRLPALAEELYRNKDDLKILVNVMSRINIQRGN